MERRYKQELKAFGKRLKELRTERGLSQLDLEVSSGIIRTEISRIENGLRNIEFLTIVKLAEALKVDLSAFFPTK
jgi:HTH-type transcriptional regulator, competence development regulator